MGKMCSEQRRRRHVRTHTRDKGQRGGGGRSLGRERAEKAFEILWTRVIVGGGAAEEWPRKMAGEERAERRAEGGATGKTLRESAKR